MEDNLLLDSLQVKGFRAFEDLQIPKLGRVNLITGKNNVGKTCLLEALQVYARRGEPNVLQSLLVRRDEMYFSNSLKQDAAAKSLENVRYIFHGRPELDSEPYFWIGPHEGQNYLIVALANDRNISDSDLKAGNVALPLELSDELKATHISESHMKWALVMNGTHNKALPLLPSTFRSRFIPDISDRQIPHTFVWSRGIDNPLLAQWWDRAVMQLADDDVVKALQIIVPKLTRVDLVGVREGNPERVPVVRLTDNGQVSSVPMKSLGEGINRMFGLVLALVSSRDGMLMVDEIETGFHYSVQPDMWRLVFQTARELNVQVFATTHSKDCIGAFEQAAREDADEEGMLIRLENKNGKVRAVSLNEEDLEIVVSEGIEVR